MYYFRIKFEFLVIFLICLIFIGFGEAETSVSGDIIEELYLKYQEAVNDGMLVL